jgi:hypothetical protein
VDTDGDGAPDSLENLLGTSITDPTSIPTGATLVQPLTYINLKAKLDFKNNKDQLTLSGEVKLKTSVSAKGTLLTYDIGGLSGQATSGNSGFKLTIGRGNIAKYTLALKGSFHDKFAGLGITNTTTNTTVKIPVYLYIGGQLYTTTVARKFSAKQGQLGSLK